MSFLWFADGGVAILQITEFVVVNSDRFRIEDFRDIFSYRSEIKCKQINGESEDETKWVVVAKNYMGFIDPREN